MGGGSERVRRGLTPAERAVVRKLLTGDFPGAEQFRRQVDAITVVRECGCGRCGTIDFEVDRQRAEPAPLPLWEDVEKVAESDRPSWLMLFQRDGWLTELEHVADHGPEPKQIDPTEIEVEEWPERHPR